MQLDNDLQTIELSNSSIIEYFNKIRRMADLLANIESPVDEKNLVTYAINGLGDRYEQVAGIIRHRDPPSTFAQAQSMLLLEESRLARKNLRHASRDTSSNAVFIATNNNRNINSSQQQICHWVMHQIIPTVGTGNGNWVGSGNASSSKGVLGPVPTNGPPAAFGPIGAHGPAGSSGYSWGPRIVYRPYPDQATTLPQSFHAITVQDYGDAGWYMDTGATSHLASDVDEYNALITNDGSLNRYKARLVSNGRSQQQGIDCDDTFSPVVKPATIRTVLSLAISRTWPIHQLDVMNAFLHGSLSTGLNRPPGTDTAYLLLYVDDIILTASSSTLLQKIISSLHSEFSMTDLGPLNYFLGISAQRTSSGLFERARMLLQPILAGSLQYLTFTRPDISYVVQQICLFMHDPREPHFNEPPFNAYLNAGCPSTRCSTSGYCVFLGDNLISWSSKQQHVTSRSSTEAEYRGVANAVAETAWVRNLLRELHVPLRSATLVYCDNISAYTDIFTKGLPSPLFTDFRFSLSIRPPPASTAGAY
ncbi:ribonuclease H-like domain-containing protein [Tanacetum coccineum]